MEVVTYWEAYIVFLVISLFFGALGCNGIWIAVGGETERAPNGDYREVWKMIFYSLYKKIANPRTTKIHYNEEGVRNLIPKMNNWFPNLSFGIDFPRSIGSKIYVTDEQKQAWHEAANELEEKYNIHVLIESDNKLKVYKEYFNVRAWSKPIVSCYKCFPSFWGSIVYWLFVAFFVHTNFICLEFPVLIPMWFLYVLALTPLNIMLHKLIED